MREEQKERALLLGVKLNDGEDFKKSMEELAALSEACGMEVVGTITQNMDRQPHASLYMGRGKLGEVQDSNLAKGYDLDTAVERAKAYISGALAAMLDLGHGSGPMDHGFDFRGKGFAEEKA